MKLRVSCMLVLAALLCAPAAVWAQDPPAPAPEAPAANAGSPDAEAPDAGADTEPAEAEGGSTGTPIEGDVVTLKNGKQLRGARVIRETPSAVEVEVVPGQPAMKIPRRQVVSVERSNAPAPAPVPSPAGTSSNASDVMLGEELAADFHRKITTPVPETPLSYENRDLIDVLEDLAKRMECAVVFEDGVRSLPASGRGVTVTIPAEATLAGFFRKEFKDAAPVVKVSYQYDKINVSLAEEPAPKEPWEQEKPGS